MSNQTSRNFLTLGLMAAAVLFGMVLAGGLDLTPAAESGPASVVTVASTDGGPAAFPSFADLAAAVDPAVVSVESYSIERRSRGGNPFEFFFGPRRDQRRQQPEQQQDDEGEEFRRPSGGSGFVVSADGLVVTNHHVIAEGEDFMVRLNDRRYPAELVGSDPATDLALLRVEAGNDLTYLNLGDSEGLRVGDWVMAVGSPLRLEKTVTVGVVSAKGRALGINEASFENYIQTDAAINFGNSGGPLINLRGEVIGINTAINYGAENVGFAVPVSTLKQILPQLRDEGRVRRGYLGVGINNLDYNSARSFGLDSTDGALVTNVTQDTPAADAGLEHGDIILEVDGRKVEETRDLIEYVSGKGPEATVQLELLRDGKTVRKSVKLAERPDTSAPAPEPEQEEENSIDWLGIRYQSLDDRLRSNHGLPEDLEGVWLTRIAQTSPLFEQGVRQGDVIAEIGGREVNDAEELEALVGGHDSGDVIRFYMLRLGRDGAANPFFVFVEVP